MRFGEGNYQRYEEKWNFLTKGAIGNGNDRDNQMIMITKILIFKCHWNKGKDVILFILV